jgi:hypothetical protein
VEFSHRSTTRVYNSAMELLNAAVKVDR